jgi:hypothetical protein
MSLLEASNFKVTARPNKPSVSVLYKPTRRRYTYTAIANWAESRRGVLASGYCVDRGGMDFSGYDDSEIAEGLHWPRRRSSPAEANGRGR